MCECTIKDREEYEFQREWMKRCMCMLHWIQTDYYRNKLNMHRMNWGMPSIEYELIQLEFDFEKDAN